MWKKLKPYIISILIALAIGGLSALLTMGNMKVFYASINKPPLAPPTTVFPIVWCILFILMGIGSAIIYLNRDKAPEAASSALKIYGLQLIVNFFWSIIFFNMQAFLFAFIWTMILWVLIIIMILQFRKINKTAAWMQVPYLIWTTFAAYLTLMIFLLNR